MRVFVVRASGAIGSRLVPQLVHRGHDVIGTSRSAAGAERIRALGATAPVPRRPESDDAISAR
jgi:nucleoside-diphosphate-sugar epimerase